MKWHIVRGLVVPVLSAVLGAMVDRGLLGGEVADAALALVQAVLKQFGL